MSMSWRDSGGSERDPESGGQQPTEFEDVYAVDFDSGTDDEGFTRPEPAPLPFVAPATVLGALASAFGIGLLFYPSVLTSFLGISTTLALLLAALLFATGAATLVSRLRNPDPDDPDDPEQGAQV